MRKRLTYANVMATLAFFFALTGASVAGVKYLAIGSPAGGDLTGTYPNPQVSPSKLLSGIVLQDGTLFYSSVDGVTVNHSFTGVYDVTLPASLPAGCPPVVSPLYLNGTPATAEVDPSGHTFGVATYMNGTEADRGFSYVVSC